MSTTETKVQYNIDGVALVGVRLNKHNEHPELYTLITYGADDVLLTSGKQLLFFTMPEFAGPAFALFPESIQQAFPPPEEVSFIYDLAKALQIVRHGRLDKEAIVIDCLNFIFDLVQTIGIAIPDKNKVALYNLADYLTFDKNIGVFFQNHTHTRSEITNAILWCVGVITTNSMIFKPESELTYATLRQ